MTELGPIVDNAAAGRFELTVDGHTAFAAYKPAGHRIVFTHTEVPSELQGRGVSRLLPDVEAELRARDAQDASRSTAPMKPAADAIILDTTALDIEHAFQMALKLVRSRLRAPENGPEAP